MPPRLTLRKREILRGYQSFSTILSKGRSLQAGTVRCYFLVGQGEGKGVKVGFTVSRSVREATARNRLRRFLREAYRMNKQILLKAGIERAHNVELLLMCAPAAETNPKRLTYDSIERPVISLLTDVNRQLS
jgi:ribonuclease P protein component